MRLDFGDREGDSRGPDQVVLQTCIDTDRDSCRRPVRHPPGIVEPCIQEVAEGGNNGPGYTSYSLDGKDNFTPGAYNPAADAGAPGYNEIMPIVIDGWNLIRSSASDLDDTAGDALESARTLVAYIMDFQKSHNDPVVLVFDSRSGHLDIDHHDTPKLKVVATKNADTYIKKYVDGVPERQRRNLRVVSSDKSVYYHAKSAYAVPVKSEEFWDKLG